MVILSFAFDPTLLDATVTRRLANCSHISQMFAGWRYVRVLLRGKIFGLCPVLSASAWAVNQTTESKTLQVGSIGHMNNCRSYGIKAEITTISKLFFFFTVALKKVICKGCIVFLSGESPSFYLGLARRWKGALQQAAEWHPSRSFFSRHLVLFNFVFFSPVNYQLWTIYILSTIKVDTEFLLDSKMGRGLESGVFGRLDFCRVEDWILVGKFLVSGSRGNQERLFAYWRLQILSVLAVAHGWIPCETSLHTKTWIWDEKIRKTCCVTYRLQEWTLDTGMVQSLEVEGWIRRENPIPERWDWK